MDAAVRESRCRTTLWSQFGKEDDFSGGLRRGSAMLAIGNTAARDTMSWIDRFMILLRVALMGAAIFVGFMPAVKAQMQDQPPERLINRVTDQSTQYWRMVASDDGQVIAVFVALGQLEGLPPLSVPVSQLIVIDRRNGTVELASRTSEGGFQNISFPPGQGWTIDAGPLSISRDGRFVSFVSSATNLDPDASTPGLYTYLYDRDTQQVRALTADENTFPSFRGASGLMDGAATRVVFRCVALAGIPLQPGEFAFCVRSLGDGSLRVVVGGFPGAVQSTTSPHFVLSRDGRKVAFASDGSILTSGAPNPDRIRHVYLMDLESGATELVSTDAAGNPGNGSSGGEIALSDDADFVAFTTLATNFGAGLPPGSKMVVKQRSTGMVRRASSINPLGSIAPHLSADGRRLLFLDYGFYSSNDIVRIYDWETNTNRAIARPLTTPPNARPCGTNLVFPFPTIDYWQRIAISGDGRTLVFASSATNLVPDDRPGCDLYVQTLGPVPQPAMPVPGPNRAWIVALAFLIGITAVVAASRVR